MAAHQTHGADAASGGSFRRHVENAPVAFVVVNGVAHSVVYANAAARRLIATAGDAVDGRPPADAFAPGEARDLVAALDRARREGAVARDVIIAAPGSAGAAWWSCTVWPAPDRRGHVEGLVITIRAATEADRVLARQRTIAERLLLSALRDQALARDSEAARQDAAFLDDASTRLGASIERQDTYATLAGLALPGLEQWCIVDIIEADGALRRLAIVHPDPAKQALARDLDGNWTPEPNDPLGVPLAMRSGHPVVIDRDIDAVLAAAAHSSENLRVLRELAGGGLLLVVPLVAQGTLLGAITFVRGRGAPPYTPDTIRLAEDLAARCARALDNARLYDAARTARADAELARREAEGANAAKAEFLATMSHELRTPLSAIGGYAQLLELGLRGPVTEAQRKDLARIQRSQEHLLGLINAVLNHARLEAGHVRYNVADISVEEVLTDTEELVTPQLHARGLRYRCPSCAEPRTAPVLVRADPEKLRQVLLNLLTNAIKFTTSGGKITVGYGVQRGVVHVYVRDTGVGISPDRLQSIFEPFVQIDRRLTRESEQGVGLGLAISRDLARAMGGDLTAESVVGEGSTFTLALPGGGA